MKDTVDGVLIVYVLPSDANSEEGVIGLVFLVLFEGFNVPSGFEIDSSFPVKKENRCNSLFHDIGTFLSFWFYMDAHYILWLPDSIFSHTELAPQFSVCGNESVSSSAFIRPEFQMNFPSSHCMSTLEVSHEQLYAFFKYSFLIQLI